LAFATAAAFAALWSLLVILDLSAGINDSLDIVGGIIHSLDTSVGPINHDIEVGFRLKYSQARTGHWPLVWQKVQGASLVSSKLPWFLSQYYTTTLPFFVQLSYTTNKT